MRFLLCTAGLWLLSASAYSQSAGKFGITAGINLAKQNFKLLGTKQDQQFKTGFHLGGNITLPLGHDLFFQSGVEYTVKGTKFVVADGADIVSLNYLEVPIFFIYKPQLGTGHLLLGFGPYASIGLSGKVNEQDGDKKVVQFRGQMLISEFPSHHIFREIDAGANLLVGYETAGRFSIQINNEFGMRNLHPLIENVTPRNTKVTNTSFGISLGYRFRKAAPHQWKSREKKHAGG